MFVWGAKIYIDQSHAPPDAMEIDVVGKQWMWKIQHATGRREIDELHVPVGRDVVLKMTTEDVIHSFFIPAFRIKQDVVPGRYTYEWFHATVPGEYHLFCAEYCGANHASMVGRVIVMEPAKYQQWLQATPADVPPAQAGEKLFQQYGCMACHGQQGPTLAGVYNSRVRLSNGQVVTADDNYLRQSILNPSAQIVDGFAPIMPTFKGQISEEQIMQIIAYIKSLQADQQPGADRTSGGAQDIFGVPTGVRPPDQGGTAPPAPATLPRSPNTTDHSR
jgi:cytochrome c oxidase subunit 2